MNDFAIFAVGLAAGLPFGAIGFMLIVLNSASPRVEDEAGFQAFKNSQHRGDESLASATGVVTGVQSQSGDHASFYSNEPEGGALGGARVAAPVSEDRGRPVLYLVSSK